LTDTGLEPRSGSERIAPAGAKSDAPTGVLLVNLGSPDAPEPAALRRYLAEFLGDPRVLEINAALRWFLLNAIILPRRSRTSAEAYRKVWCKKGSPLIAISRRQAELVACRLGEAYRVELAMRYGNPSIAAGLERLVASGCDRIVVLTAFPQYSNATTGSVYAEVFRVVARERAMPSVAFVPPYYDHPGYLDALAASIRPHLERFRPDHVLLSFHGIPERYAREGDPYPVHCEATAREVAGRLALDEGRWTLTYQSRFGREPWLRPYTDETVRALARDCRRLLVASPGFTADCLETIEEIGQENRGYFLDAGGEELRFVPCLNSRSQWIDAMTDLVRGAAA